MVYADTSGKLPCFPTVTRDGYSFDGWYVVPANQIPQSADMNAEPEFMTEFGSYPKARFRTVVVVILSPPVSAVYQPSNVYSERVTCGSVVAMPALSDNS